MSSNQYENLSALGLCEEAYKNRPTLTPEIHSFIAAKIGPADTEKMSLKQAIGFVHLLGELKIPVPKISALIPTVADIDDMDLAELIRASQIMNLNDAPDAVITALEKRMAPTGVAFTPGEQSKFMVFGHSNLRVSQAVVTALIGTTALLYRALEERSQSGAYEQHRIEYNEKEKGIIKSFLDNVLTYNPTVNIDRLTSEYYDPTKRVKLGTKTLEVRSESTKRGKKTVNKAVPSIEEDQIKIDIDIQAEAFAKVMNYLRVNYDAIHKIANGTTVYGSYDAAERDIMAKTEYIEQEVTSYKVSGGIRTKLNSLVIPGPDKHFEDVLYVSGELFNTQEEATNRMMQMKNKTVMPLHVGHTDAMIFTADWRANRQKTTIGNSQIDAMIKQMETDQRIYGEMTKERVKYAKMISMIENGPEHKKFKEFVRDLHPDRPTSSLNEEESEEVMAKWQRYVNENVVYSNDDADFMAFCRRKKPSRDFNRKPLSMMERKEFSRMFAEETDVRELPLSAEAAAMDMFVQTPDGLTVRREYGQLPVLHE